MTDNTTLNPGTAGDTIRTIDRSADSTPIPSKTQVVALDIGGESNESLLSPTNALPVDLNNAAPEGAVFNAANVPDVGVVAGKGIDGLVHTMRVDPNGTVHVVERAAENARDPQNPLTIRLVGAPEGNFSGIDLLEQVIDPNTGLTLAVTIANPPKADATGAAIVSDAIALQINLSLGGTIFIDTTGYNSVGITTQTLAGNVTATNDLKTLSALTGTPLILGAYVTAVTSGAGFVFPAAARYVAITATTAGTASIYLRSAPWNANYTTTVPTGVAQENMSQYGGSAVVTGGVAGVPSAGGNVAPGAARTANPVPVGGVDASNLTRAMLTDTSGRAQAAEIVTDFTSAQRQAGAVMLANSQIPALLTADSSFIDGSNPVELLFKILTELRVLNHQMFLLNSQGGCVPGDDLGFYRSEESIFNPTN